MIDVALVVGHGGGAAAETVIHSLLQVFKGLLQGVHLVVQVVKTVGGDVPRIIREGAHIGGLVQDLLHAGGGIPVGVHLCGGDGRRIGEVVVAAGGGHRRQVRRVGQGVVVAVKTRRQLHIAATRQEQRVVADAQHLLLCERGQVARVVGKGTHVGRHCRDGRRVGKIIVVACCGHRGEIRLVGQGVVVAVKSRRQLHIAAARQEKRVVADAQHLLLSERGQVAGVIGKGAHIGRHRRDGRRVGKIIVIACCGHRREIRLVEDHLHPGGGCPVGGQLRYLAAHGRNGVRVSSCTVCNRDDNIGTGSSRCHGG